MELIKVDNQLFINPFQLHQPCTTCPYFSGRFGDVSYIMKLVSLSPIHQGKLPTSFHSIEVDILAKIKLYQIKISSLLEHSSISNGTVRLEPKNTSCCF
jgi:hypothetical protein